QNGPPARRDEGAYLDRYVTEEQRSRRPIFIATLRAARLLPAALSLIGQRPQRVFSLFASRIQPKYTVAPLHQSLTWCTSSHRDPTSSQDSKPTRSQAHRTMSDRQVAATEESPGNAERRTPNARGPIKT